MEFKSASARCNLRFLRWSSVEAGPHRPLSSTVITIARQSVSNPLHCEISTDLMSAQG